MKIIRLVCALSLPLLLASCAHQINISPNLNSLQAVDSRKKIDKRLGFLFVESKEKEVITPGGGGDSVRYKPYREIEDGLVKVFQNTFKSVVPLKSATDLENSDVDYLAELKIATSSSSSSAVTWPPTQFGINLSCNIKDLNGDVVTTIQANGEGNSEFNEWFLADKGLSGKRAAEDLLNKFQSLLVSNKKLTEVSVAGLGEKNTYSVSENNISSKIRGKWEASITEPDINGVVLIKIKSSTPIISLKINGEEFGEGKSGFFQIRKSIKIGSEETFQIASTDIAGTIETAVLTANRKFDLAREAKYARLNPELVKPQSNKEAVAIIIGIADYKNLPRADYANDDARVFYDYAIRALGVKPENIKLLVDADADEVGIYRAFKTWLPSRVRSTTDVYIFYSGHGLPTADGKGLYVLPQRADRDFIDKTAITQAELNAAIQATKPKSVMIFLDACYSGQARTGETLLASARPVSLKADTTAFPDSFTVITASRGDQISSSSPELKHGIFSYYLMRGMEGDADTNKDGKITAGEMHMYLADNVARHASLVNRVQSPQLTGDANRVLVGK